MKARRTIIASAITIGLGCISIADDYVILVTQNTTSYNIVEDLNDKVTSWANVGEEYDCVKRYHSDNYNLGTIFTQIEDCKQDQSRTITKIKIINGEEIETDILEEQTINTQNNYQENGTKNYITGQRTEYSEWTNVEDVYDCEDWSPLTSDVYTGTNFTQNRSCKQKQERDKDVYNVWYDGSETTDNDNSLVEENVISVAETNDTTGTFIAKSCKEILNSQGSTGDGLYTINLDSTNRSVFCDMTTDGGGWTVVADQDLYFTSNENKGIGYPTANAGIPNNDPNDIKNSRLTRWPKYTEFAIASKIDRHGAPYDASLAPEFRKYNTGSFGEVEVDMMSFFLDKNNFQNGRAKNEYVTYNGVPWGDSHSHASYRGYSWFGNNFTYDYWGQSDFFGHIINSDLFRISSLHEGYARTAGCGGAWANNACRESKNAFVYRNTVKQKAIFMVR